MTALLYIISSLKGQSATGKYNLKDRMLGSFRSEKGLQVVH